MTFSGFKKLVSKIGKIELPGEESHFRMAPFDRRERFDESMIEKRNPMFAGVLVLFYPNKEGEAMLVLILRKTYDGVHSGQISLPGGKKEESDGSMLETALRETHEEIGVVPEKTTILKELTKLYIPPSNFWVYPFLGIVGETPNFVSQESEVEAIVEIKVGDFLDDGFLIEQNMTTSYAENIKVPAFLLEEKVVWGATGMILNEVREILKDLVRENEK